MDLHRTTAWAESKQLDDQLRRWLARFFGAGPDGLAPLAACQAYVAAREEALWARVEAWDQLDETAPVSEVRASPPESRP